MKVLLEALDKYDKCPRCGANWGMLQRMLDNGGAEHREAIHLISEITRGGCSLCTTRWRKEDV